MYRHTYENAIQRLSDGAFIPADPDNVDYQAYQSWLAAGNVPEAPAAASFEARVTANTAAIQAALDSGAQARGYDNILSACSYAAQPEGAPFKTEGMAFLAWRSEVWASAYAYISRVQLGEIPLPTPEEAVAMMPQLRLSA